MRKKYKMSVKGIGEGGEGRGEKEEGIGIKEEGEGRWGKEEGIGIKEEGEGRWGKEDGIVVKEEGVQLLRSFFISKETASAKRR